MLDVRDHLVHILGGNGREKLIFLSEKIDGKGVQSVVRDFSFKEELYTLLFLEFVSATDKLDGPVCDGHCLVIQEEKVVEIVIKFIIEGNLLQLFFMSSLDFLMLKQELLIVLLCNNVLFYLS